jgi:hypothetical protein
MLHKLPDYVSIALVGEEYNPGNPLKTKGKPEEDTMRLRLRTRVGGRKRIFIDI